MLFRFACYCVLMISLLAAPILSGHLGADLFDITPVPRWCTLIHSAANLIALISAPVWLFDFRPWRSN
jgi:hypothetical protein